MVISGEVATIISKVELSLRSSWVIGGLRDESSSPAVGSCESSEKLNCRISHISGTLRYILDGIQSSTSIISGPAATLVILSRLRSLNAFVSLAQSKNSGGRGTYKCPTGGRRRNEALQKSLAFCKVCVGLVLQPRSSGTAVVEMYGGRNRRNVSEERVSKGNLLVNDHVDHAHNPCRV